MRFPPPKIPVKQPFWDPNKDPDPAWSYPHAHESYVFVQRANILPIPIGFNDAPLETKYQPCPGVLQQSVSRPFDLFPQRWARQAIGFSFLKI